MNKYVFKPYDPDFPNLFAKEKKRISTFIQLPLIVEHVGSTAVPGLGGKGIIDIAIAIEKEFTEPVSQQIQDLGYRFHPNFSTEERLFFKIDLPDLKEGIRTYHLHLTYAETKDWQGLILFRDYLTSHPEEAKEYEELKIKASKEAHEDGSKYRKLKEPVINKVLTKASQKNLN